jgi:hypothetical protein
MGGFNSSPLGTSPAQTPVRKSVEKQEGNQPKVEFSGINKALVDLKRHPFVVAPENSPIISFLPFSSFPSLKNMERFFSRTIFNSFSSIHQQLLQDHERSSEAFACVTSLLFYESMTGYEHIFWNLHGKTNSEVKNLDQGQVHYKK